MKEKLLHERALVTCIAMLFICIILKLFGIQWFDLNTDIPILQEIDKVVMNSVPLSFLYSFVLTMINGYLVCIVIDRSVKIHFVKLCIVSIISIFMSYYSINFTHTIIRFMFDTLCFYFVVSNRNIKNYLSVILLNIFYQYLSLFIRSIMIASDNYSLIIGSLLNLDYYILMIMTYFYVKSKEVDDRCLIIQVFGSSLANLLWKKRSENYSNKEGN